MANILANAKGEKVYDAGKYPMLLTHQMGVPFYSIADPDVIQCLATTKNHQIDKNGELELIFKDMLGNSFLLSKGDELWR